jgi:hypothetical protein
MRTVVVCTRKGIMVSIPTVDTGPVALSYEGRGVLTVWATLQADITTTRGPHLESGYSASKTIMLCRLPFRAVSNRDYCSLTRLKQSGHCMNYLPEHLKTLYFDHTVYLWIPCERLNKQ